MRRSNFLFSGEALLQVFESRRRKVLAEINSFTKDYILNTSVADLCTYLEEKYRFKVPIIDRDNAYIDSHGEVDIDVSKDPMRAIFDRSQPFYIKGNYVEFAVPFEGDSSLFGYRASTYSSMPPRATIKGNELRFRYENLDRDPDKVRNAFLGALNDVIKNLEWTASDVNTFNNSLSSIIKQAIEGRKQRLLQDDSMVAALGFPIKKREGAPTTYTVPVSRKKAHIRKPPATSELPWANVTGHPHQSNSFAV